MVRFFILVSLCVSHIAKADEKIEQLHTYFNSITLLNEGIDLRINGMKNNSRKEAQSVARKLNSCDYYKEQKRNTEEHLLSGPGCAIDHSTLIEPLPTKNQMRYSHVVKSTFALDPNITRNNILIEILEETNYEYLPGPYGSQNPDILNYDTTAKSSTLGLGDVGHTIHYKGDFRVQGREKIAFTVVVESESLNATAEYKALGSREICKIDQVQVDCFELAYALGVVEAD